MATNKIRAVPAEWSGNVQNAPQDPMVSLSNGFQPPTSTRPIISTLDTWDQSTQMEYGYSMPSAGRRPAWNVPSIAVTSESVNTIRQSAPTRAQSPSLAQVNAMTNDPTYNPPAASDIMKFKPIASMSQAIKPTANVQVSFSVSVTANQNTSPEFAIYRDGVQISQIYHQNIIGGIRSMVSGAYVDTNPSPLKNHVYEFRIRPTNVPVTAWLKSRTFQCSDLRAI